MFRSIIGIVVGYFVFAASTLALFVATGHDPHDVPTLAFAIFSVISGVILAGAGGYLAGVIAGRRPRLHGGIVGIVLATGATASLLSQEGSGSSWSQIAAILLMAPSAALGGYLREKHQPGR